MQEYVVNTYGHVTVEAENQEEAERKAEDHVYGHGDRHDVTEMEADPLHQEKDRFQIKVQECGSNKRNAGYRLMKDKSALRLAHHVVENMSRDFVGQDKASFKYELACLILSGLDGDSLTKDNIWEFHNELKEEVQDKGYDEVVGEMWAIVDEEDSSTTSDRGDEK